MQWWKGNWKRVAKWSGLGAGCFTLVIAGFVFARWLESGAEYEGELLDLAPTEVSVVMTIDNVPNRKAEIDRFLDQLVQHPELAQLERSSLWRDSLGKSVGESLDQFRNEKYDAELGKARTGADEVGIELFKDVLAGELVICTDPGPDGSELLMLSRVERNVRFKWQFLDVVSGLLPEGPNQPKLEYSDGILKVTPPARPDQPAPRTMLIALLDDVLVISNSTRLMNGAIALHGSGGKGMSASPTYKATAALVEPALRERHVCGLYVDLDRLRTRLPARVEPDGREVSPVDAYNSLPKAVVAIQPDVFAPVNRIVSQDLDTRPFRAAWYGFDVTEPGVVSFDQFLLVHEERVEADEFKHLRDTWKLPAAPQSQLRLLPADTMLQVSYRQPMDVMYNDVMDEAARLSLPGDFIVAINSEVLRPWAPSPVEEVMFAAAPRSYAPTASIPLSGADVPLPAFLIAFRSPGAQPQAARVWLEEYLQVQRGRGDKPGEEPKKGAVSVVKKDVPGMQVWGFEDPREEDNFVKRLNLSMRASVVGDWIILTNSESLMSATAAANDGRGVGLANAPGSPFRSLADSGHASIYLDFERFTGYVASRELFKVLRDNKFNPTLPEGRDPRELREEIAAARGYDPADTSSLSKPDVEQEYQQRKAIWEQTCIIEGDRYIAELQADMNGLKFFRDLTLNTTFAPDHLHVHGILRLE